MAQTIKISEQHQNGQFKGYKKFIGGKLFTLGKNRELAERSAQALVIAWQSIEKRGGKWTDQDIAQAKAFALGVPVMAEQADEVQPTSPNRKVSQKKTLTVLQAFSEYKEHLKGCVVNKEIGTATYQGLCDRLDASLFGFAGVHFSQFYDHAEHARFLADDKSDMATFLLRQAYAKSESEAKRILSERQWADLTDDDLLKYKAYFTKRPISIVSGNPIAVQTVTNNVHSVARMLRDVRKPPFRWTVPEFWEDSLKFRRNSKRNMRTLSERAERAADRDMISEDDLKHYWKLSIPRTRCFQGLAYWCAWTQMEISTLRKFEVFVDMDGETYIDKRRSKTGEWGKWWIPRPIAKLLVNEMAKTSDDSKVNPDGLAFLTAEGYPLVHHGKGTDPDARKSDLIGNYLWTPVQRAAEKNYGRSHSFKWFRKSSSEAIRKLTKNQHIVKAFMAQDNPDVADEHYLNRMIDESVDAARKLWEVLKDAYATTSAKKTAAS